MKKKIVILLGFFMCSMLNACGTGQEKAVDVSQNTSVAKESSGDTEENIKDLGSTEQSVSSEVQTTETEKAEEENTIYAINDVAALKDWEISVTDMQIVESIASGDYLKFDPQESGNKFAQVFVTVNNKGKTADSFLPSYVFGDDVNAKIIYGDGYEFSSTNLLGYSNELHDTSINPLSSKTGEIVFEVPETVASSEDELILEFSSEQDSVRFKIR